MAGSDDSGNNPLEETDILATGSTAEVERLLEVADIGDADQQAANAVSGIESVDFMTDQQGELVDLDALFDALNVAANEGVDAMRYIEDGDVGSVLIVTNEAMASVGVSSSLDDLGAVSDDFVMDPVMPDES